MWQFDKTTVQDRFKKNLEFFQRYLPDLFKIIQDVRFERLTLSIDENKQRWDVFDGQRSLYLGDAEKYIDEEVAEMQRIFPENVTIQTINPVQRHDYGGPRFFHNHLNKTINQMDYRHIDNKSHYLPDFLPTIVFSGVGTGVHIQRFLEQRDCRIVLIMENAPEALLLSFYMTDWYKIIPEYTRNQGRFLNFIIVRETDEERIFQGYWNELCRFIPLFPVLNVFYNHLKNAMHHRLIEKIQREFQVFITVWGFYDDEANQLNNALHTLRNLIPSLPLKLPTRIASLASDMPAVIVGAGPSLNQRIDWIKENRDRIFLFSAGTALSVLKHNGLVPDMHVEIESDYATVLHLSHTIDENYQVPLLAGAIQLNPKVFQFSPQSLFYFKDSTALHSMFGDKCSAQLLGMTPTCTNAATGLAMQLGFNKVFLFGMDFGYTNTSDSHAKGSVYFDKKAPQHLQSIATTRRGTMKIKSITGEDIITEPIYNSARDRVEKLLALHVHRAKIYNCSLGAHIEHTEVLNEQSDFEALLGEAVDQDYYRQMLLNETVLIMPSEIDRGLVLAQNFMDSVCKVLLKELDRMEPNRISFIITLLNMSRSLEEFYRSTKSSLYFLVRGSLWHYLNAGISVSFGTANEDIANQHLVIWKKRFQEFLNLLPDHFSWVSHRDVSVESDTWLDKRITEMVDDPFYQDSFANPFGNTTDVKQ